jgi:hypothetical protein
MRKLLCILLILSALPLSAQVDRKEVRAGNRKFRKGDFKNSEIDYRRAVVKDSLSVAGEYNLASTLYRQENYDEAGKALETIKDVAAADAHAADYYYNVGDVALQKKDYGAAVKAFRESLLRNPGDLDAKENYIYAKKMLKNQQGGGEGDQDQNQNQNQDQQNQDQNQDQQQQQQDQNQDQNRDQQQQQQDQQPQPQMSPQQAQQMLQAVQAKEKETQDKVNKQKALLLKSREKEKNW